VDDKPKRGLRRAEMEFDQTLGLDEWPEMDQTLGMVDDPWD
jgi:hypothetical protein